MRFICSGNLLENVYIESSSGSVRQEHVIQGFSQTNENTEINLTV
jgi:hypothetical protein